MEMDDDSFPESSCFSDSESYGSYSDSMDTIVSTFMQSEPEDRIPESVEIPAAVTSGFPRLPPAIFYSAVSQPAKFATYIASEIRGAPEETLPTATHRESCEYVRSWGTPVAAHSQVSNKLLLNTWFSATDIQELTALPVNHATLDGYKFYVEPHLPEFWKDFSPYIVKLIDATWEKRPLISNKNTATHRLYRQILLEALEYYEKNRQR